MSEQWGDDERLSTLLSEALVQAPEEVPRAVVEAAYAVFTWRSIDVELAALTYDSMTDDLAGAGARSEQAPLRALTFAGRSLIIELEIEPSALLGQLVPAGAGEVVVAGEDGQTRTVAVNAVGCFTITPLPSGRFRLHVIREADEAGVATDWVTL